MTSLMLERFDLGSGRHATRSYALARERAADALAGRKVWNATALPASRASARALRGRIEIAAEEGVAVGILDVATDPPLRQLAERVDAMLVGGRQPVTRVPLGLADQDLYREGVRNSDPLVGQDVRPDDIVVMHDPLAAMLAQAVRERGAHAVLRLRIGPTGDEPVARQARAFLRRFTDALDAYVTTSPHAVGHGTLGARIAALMPGPAALAAKDLPEDDYGPVAWCCLLADVVLEDRDERVGGRLHPRPAVAPR
jgi:trehalose synthase